MCMYAVEKREEKCRLEAAVVPAYIIRHTCTSIPLPGERLEAGAFRASLAIFWQASKQTNR